MKPDARIRFKPDEHLLTTRGLAAFDAEQPDMVLLDINLPDGSGIDALREIKQRDADAIVLEIYSNMGIAWFGPNPDPRLDSGRDKFDGVVQQV